MESNKEKVCVYIDGSNFYNYLKYSSVKFGKGKTFNFDKFVDYLVGEQRELISKRYYTGVIRNVDKTKKSEELVKGQQKFISKLKKGDFSFKPGRIIYDAGSVREKGTDVKIAVDIVVGAIDDNYDTAILVSSDTDLIPAIKYARYKKKKIEYVGFSFKPSYGMKEETDKSRLLSANEIQKFVE